MGLTLEHPGCYGLPIAVSANSPSCNACPSRAGCLYEAGCLLESLPNNPLTQRERLAFSVTRQALAGTPPTATKGDAPVLVVASARGVQRMALSPAQRDAIARLPARVAAQVRQLAERGWFDFAKAEMRAGRNPASKGWKRVFCDALLSGGIKRPDLVLALSERLDLSPKSAVVQASVGISIFAAGRIATEQFGVFKLLPN